MIVVITGALASGKTTISKEVAKRLRGEYISVDSVLTNHKLDQFPWGTYSIPLENFIAANKMMKPAIEVALESNKPVIIDGCFYFRKALDDLLRDIPKPHHVFTLIAPIEVCIERDRQREHSLGEEAARGVYHLTSKLTLGEELDATEPVEKSVERIVAAVIGA